MLDVKLICKIYSSFANSEGGEVIFGIYDEKESELINERWCGLKSVEDYNPVFTEINKIDPERNYKAEFLTFKENNYQGYLLYIIVEKSNKIISMPDGSTVYERINAQCQRVTTEQISRIEYEKGVKSYENDIVKDVSKNRIIDSLYLTEYLNQIKSSRGAENFLRLENFIGYDSNDVRASAILLFDELPSSVMPKKCAVKIVVYRTREDNPDREDMREEPITLEGPLYKLINDTVEQIILIMSNMKIEVSNKYVKVEYPREAIQEIVTNAIIHRDYSISDDVRITIFENRIEFESPGKLPIGITPDNILEKRESRNSKIVRILSKYKNAPNKDLGEGLKTAFQKMQDWKLEAPIVEERSNGITVILKNKPLAEPQVSVLAYLEKNEHITNKEARELTGIKSENSMKQVFYNLRNNNKIERVEGLGGSKSAWKKKSHNSEINKDTITKTSQISHEESMGAYVRRTIKNANLKTEEIEKLCTREYSRELFGTSTPIFRNVTGKTKEEINNERFFILDNKGNYARYYAKTLILKAVDSNVAQELLLSSQWGNSQRKKYDQWMEMKIIE